MLWLRIGAVLTTGFTLTVTAAPPSLQDLWIAAQQASASGDFAKAYELSNDVVKQSPNFIAARRVAAFSARELRRFDDCLRHIGRIPERTAEPNDIGLVGECSYETKEITNFSDYLKRQMRISNKRDYAAYWLGKEAFRLGRWDTAKDLLAIPTVLPQRLENDRQELLRKLRTAADQVRSPDTPQHVTQPGSSTPRSQSTPHNVNHRYADPISVRQQATQSFANAFWSYSALFRADGGYESVSEEVALDPFTQIAYETNQFDPRTINKSARSGPLASASTSLTGSLNYQTSGVAQSLRLVGESRVSMAATVAQPRGWLYRPAHAPAYPDVVSWFPTRGWNLGILQRGAIHVGRSFGIFADLAYEISSDGATHQHPILSIEGGAFLTTRSTTAETRVGWTSIYGPDKRAGLQGYTWLLDLDVTGLGEFSIVTPPGIPLMRFSEYVTLNNSTRYTLEFLLHEGRFWEINTMPAIELAPRLALYFWYRWLRADERQYWTASEATGNYGIQSPTDESTVLEARQPVAKYTSTTNSVAAGLRIPASQRIDIDVGIGYRRNQTTPNNFAPDNLEELRGAGRATPAEFWSLLDAGGHKSFVIYARTQITL